MKQVRNKIRMGMKFISLIAFPATAGYMVLSFGIMKLLFHDTAPLAGSLLAIGSLTIVFYSMSTLTNGVLQGIDRMLSPVIHALIALVSEAVLLFVMVRFLHMGIYSVVFANIFEAFIMFILNGISIRQYTKLSVNIVKTYLIPALSAIIMGIGVWLIYNSLLILGLKNAASVIISIIFGMFVYFIFLLLLGGLDKKELMALPLGSRIARVCERLYLI